MISKDYNFDGHVICVSCDERGKSYVSLQGFPDICASGLYKTAMIELAEKWESFKEEHIKKYGTLPVPNPESKNG